MEYNQASPPLHTIRIMTRNRTRMRPKPRRLRARETGVVVVTIGHLGFYGQTAGLDNGYSSAEVQSACAPALFARAARCSATIDIPLECRSHAQSEANSVLNDDNAPFGSKAAQTRIILILKALPGPAPSASYSPRALRISVAILFALKG